MLISYCNIVIQDVKASPATYCFHKIFYRVLFTIQQRIASATLHLLCISSTQHNCDNPSHHPHLLTRRHRTATLQTHSVEKTGGRFCERQFHTEMTTAKIQHKETPRSVSFTTRFKITAFRYNIIKAYFCWFNVHLKKRNTTNL